MLLSIEGIDGSGKSTQAEKLFEYLKRKNRKVELLREPGATQVGESIREILFSQSPSPLAELFLFEAARAELIEKKVKPLLKGGYLVILDRFTDSTLAYQGYGRGIEIELVMKLNEIASQGVKPDITFLIDVEPRTALSRIDKPNRFEKLDFIKRVREGFLQIAQREKERIFIIDGNRPPSAVFNDIKRILKERLWDLGKL